MLLDGDLYINKDTQCFCGRDKDRRHCPHCGYVNFYALKQVTKRPHPLTGDLTETSTFRCRSCNKLFDDLQWQFECKAPRSLRTQAIQKKELNKDSLLRQAEGGKKFDENEKRHFRKITGMRYEDYLNMWKLSQQLKQKEMDKLTNHMASKFGSHGVGHLVPDLKKLTPLQYHIENCNHCMANDEMCDVGKNLEIAERMPQP